MTAERVLNGLAIEGLELNIKKKEAQEKRALFKKKKIGVLMGGLSEEREISLKSGGYVHKALIGLGYNAIALDAGTDMALRLRANMIEAAFIALHGGLGEDGSVQGLLEVMGVAYTGSGVLASALAMNKAAAKVFLDYHGIPTPEFTLLKEGEEAIDTALPLPLIIKPLSQGSTIGISLVRKKGRFLPAVKEARRHDRSVLVERFIEGRELTVSILDGRVFPIIEIMPKKGIFDFEAKYMKAGSELSVPARLKQGVEAGVRKTALSAYNTIGCRGAARVDIILEDRTSIPYVLEINTVPGMTDVSLLPFAAKAAGIRYPELVEEMLFGAGVRKH
ncbi:MAG: D-alanine--D-alanine ligase [Deltaproteobacteria bacterium]|nr:D-alanine--D-alanine ligase [Deltaproteobacteria bacterium]